MIFTILYFTFLLSFIRFLNFKKKSFLYQFFYSTIFFILFHSIFFFINYDSFIEYFLFNLFAYIVIFFYYAGLKKSISVKMVYDLYYKNYSFISIIIWPILLPLFFYWFKVILHLAQPLSLLILNKFTFSYMKIFLNIWFCSLFLLKSNWQVWITNMKHFRKKDYLHHIFLLLWLYQLFYSSLVFWGFQ